MKRKFDKLVLLATACTGMSLAGSYLTTRLLVKTALDRDVPEMSKRIAKKKGNILSRSEKSEDFEKEYLRCAEELKNRDNVRVEISANDGKKLVGHWIPAEKPKRIIIAMHGWRSGWYRDFGMVYKTWEENGCSVLYTEQRGQNESDGSYMGFGLAERYDCQSWAYWASENISSEIPIYLAGVSMGATTVLLASELLLPSNVKGVMADCGFTSPDAIWKHIAKNNLHIKYKLKSIFADEIYKHVTEEDSRYSTADALQNTKLPVMLVHGADDHFVPVEMTIENYRACKSEKELLIVPGADHGMSYFLAKDQYEEMAKGFWEAHD